MEYSRIEAIWKGHSGCRSVTAVPATFNRSDVPRYMTSDRVNKRNDCDRASSVHATQKEAVKAAHEMLENQGGGELAIKGRDGQIRSKDTIYPGNDPNPPRDREH